MPELPEVEITARRLNTMLSGARVGSARAPGVATLKTFDPPLEELADRELTGVRRIGKMLLVEFDGDLGLLVHLMSAGRIALLESPGSPRERPLRLSLEMADGRELRLREFGTRQSAWAKLLPTDEVVNDPAVATLGPEAWPAPPPEQFAGLVDQPRHLHPLLRDQRTIAGIGRSWVDEILWEARLSPFQQGEGLGGGEIERLRVACGGVLGAAIDHYEQTIEESALLPDKQPKPLKVHARQGEACPRCGETLAAVFFKDRVTTYCPAEQTAGRVLKDRRLSRLLK
jgi:formamidopyrimidine-DNA glycosylase